MRLITLLGFAKLKSLGAFVMLLMATLLAASLATGQTSSPTPAVSAPASSSGGFASSAPAPSLSQDFNHNKTGFRLDGLHLKARCESCHVEGIFRGTPRDCAKCHTVGNKTSSLLVMNQMAHIVVMPGKACDTCHISTTSFRVWRMDHSATTAACTTCHSGQSFESVVPTTKSATHLQTTENCSLCHSSQTSFATVSRFDHTGITDGCATCHNGIKAQGKPVGHLPTSLPCESCHNQGIGVNGGFALWQMNHTGITGGCANCHNGQTFLGVAPMSKPVGHKLTNLACEVCHGTANMTTGGFAFAIQGNPHTGTPSNPLPTQPCSSCHNGTAATGQIAGHIATNAGALCSDCHNPTAASFAVFTMNHAKVSAACSTCHAAGKSFIGAPNLKTKPLGNAHIPTTVECSVCHQDSTFSTFAGQGSGWVMNHTGARITSGCANCHNTGTLYPSVLGKPATPGHIPTAAACESCHNAGQTSTGQFRTSWTMNHTGIATGCATCHDSSVSGFGTLTVPALVVKSANHIPTVAACESCHLATSTATGNFAAIPKTRMNHAGITSCNICHDPSRNTTYAGGMAIVTQSPTGHVPTSGQDCSACHSSTQIPGGFTLAPASFDHVRAGVRAGTCTSCHNGTQATGLVTNHITINSGVECDACHNYTLGTFARWTIDHSKVSATCTTCHAATVSPTQFPAATTVTAAGHFPIGTLNCSQCHASTVVPGGFKTWTMDHSLVTATSCATCHDNGARTIGATALVLKPTTGHIAYTANTPCSTCHRSTTIPGGFKTWTMDHSVVSTTCASCHSTGVGIMASSPALVIKPSTGHIPNPGNLDCRSCHTSTVVTGGFATWVMDHTFPANTRCDSCHGTTTAKFPSVANQVVGHVATSQDCGSCHTSTSPGGFAASTTGGISPHSVATPPNPTCTNCHGNASAATPAPGMPQMHIATTAQCGSCHKTPWASFANAQMDHTAVSTTTCANCHGAGKSFVGVPAVKTVGSVANHIAFTGDCVKCHTSFTAFSNWTMNHTGITTGCATCHDTSASFTGLTPPALKVKATNHIPTTAACESCHVASGTSTGNFQTIPNTRMNHTGITSCNICHDPSRNTTYAGGMTIVTHSPTGHVPTSGQDCVNCHTSTQIPGGFSLATTVFDHVRAGVRAGTCSTCHSSGNGATAMVTNHITVNSGVECDACHSYTLGTFARWTIDHSKVSATCTTCHAATVSPTQFPAATTVTAAGHFPIGTLNCSQCHASTVVPGGFKTWTMNHSLVTATSCATCHDNGATTVGATALVLKPTTGHIAYTANTPCSTCHRSTTIPGGFKTWTMDHSVVSTTCKTCHDIGVSFMASSPALVNKPTSGHIPNPGNLDCRSCHTSTVVTGGFATWVMDHTGIASPATRCDTCHGTTTIKFPGVVNQPTGHPATGVQDCYGCHTSTAVGGFATATSGVNPHTATRPVLACTSCHGVASAVLPAIVAPGKPTPHIATTAACDSCHSWSSTTFANATMNHASVSTATCAGCHGAGKTFVGTPPVKTISNVAAHIPVTGDCVKCHTTTNVADAFRTWNMDHTAVNVASCNACHANSSSFTNTGTGPQVKTKASVNHIPVADSTDCSSCHSSTATNGFAAWTMNHSVVTATPCGTCHETGRTYTNNGGRALVTKPAGHFLINALGNDCSICHGTAYTSFVIPAPYSQMNHNGVNTAGCITCHGVSPISFTNVTPVAKSSYASHQATGATDCNSSGCHTSTQVPGGFALARHVHGASDANRCYSCHSGGGSGLGPITGHITTGTTSCDACHTYNAPLSFATQVTMNHSVVSGLACTASGCHNAARSVGSSTLANIVAMPPQGTGPTNHVTLLGSPSCGTCHTSQAPGGFRIWTMNHTAVNTAICSTCHKNSLPAMVLATSVTVMAKSTNHVRTTTTTGLERDCSACHTSTSSFALGSMNHNGITAGCNTCHNGTPYAGVTPVSLPAAHIRTTAALPTCESCHRSTATFTQWTMDHTQVTTTSNCKACHSGQTFATGVVAVTQPSNHIPTTGGKAVECNQCHTNTSSFIFTGTVMNHTAAAISTTTCANCHGGQVFATSFTAKTKPANHITVKAGVDCVSCHTNTSSFTKPTFSSAEHSLNGNTTACATCHNGQTFAGVTMKSKPANHMQVGTATDCVFCHTNTSTFAGQNVGWSMTTQHTYVSAVLCSTCHAGQTFANGVVPRNKNSISNHVPIAAAPGGGECNNCHTGTSTFTAYKKNIGSLHTTALTGFVAGGPCNNCHGATTPLYMGVDYQGQGNHPSNGKGLTNCKNCHSTSKWD